MASRVIETELWTSPQFAQLSAASKLLFLYLRTNRHAHVCGLYQIADPTIVHETGLSVPLEWDELKRFVQRDEDIVWVLEMSRFQLRGQKNERGAAKHLQSLPESRLIKDFLVDHPGVARFMDRERHIKRKKLPPRLRFWILRRDNFTCQYCGAKAPDGLLDVDHVIPVADGGGDDGDNLIAACGECNAGKGRLRSAIINDESSRATTEP